MVMDLPDRDRARISDAIRASEARTPGEIVCVLARTSAVEATTALPALIAVIVALCVPWLLMAFTTMSLQLMLSLQVLTFLGLLSVSCLPQVRVALIPRAVRRALAHRLAMEQFVIRGIARTKDRTGVLIFVSLAERYARIIADDGIAARVPQAEWQGAVDSLVAHIREDRLADGFISAIGLCADVLEKHFPSAGAEPSEVPDRIYLI
jgi:putative membrane protein